MSVGVLISLEPPASHEFLSVQFLLSSSVTQRCMMFPSLCPLILPTLALMLLTHVWLLFVPESPSTLQSFSASASARRVASSSADDRFTPDLDDGSCCTGCSCLCRFASCSSANQARASPLPISRSLFVTVAVHIVSGTVSLKILTLRSVGCQSFCDTACSRTSCHLTFASQLLSSVSVPSAIPECSSQDHPVDSRTILHDGVVSHLDAVAFVW